MNPTAYEVSISRADDGRYFFDFILPGWFWCAREPGEYHHFASGPAWTEAGARKKAERVISKHRDYRYAVLPDEVEAK